MFEDKELTAIYEKMVLMRKFEEATVRLYNEGLVTGSLHPYIGQEAVAATAAALMRSDDMLTSTHRGLGHCVARGMDINLIMAELFGKAAGIGGGKGGSMHLFDPEKGILGTNGIVAGGTSIAVGAALTAKELKKTDSIVYCFFGEGASNEGVTHESMNMAALWKLPVIFVCENNKYQVFTTAEESCSVENVATRASAYGMPGTTVDGNNVMEMEKAFTAAVARARKGEGPSLVECGTYRWEGHWPGDVYSYGGYRTEKEVDDWKAKCPIIQLGGYLTEKSIASEKDLAEINIRVDIAVGESISFAEKSPAPDESELMNNLFSL